MTRIRVQVIATINVLFWIWIRNAEINDLRRPSEPRK